jgi:GGDEF domain-containing protein
MAGAGFILAINLFIAALFALAFFLVGISNRADKVAPFFSLAYVFGIVYIASEFILPQQDYPQFAYTAGFAAFLGAVTAVTLGVARRYGRPLPWAGVSAIVVVSVLANWFGYSLPHDTVERNLIYQTPYAVMQACAAWIILASRRRQPIDIGLVALFGLSALQFLSKPFAAVLLGGSGDSTYTYLTTTYALYSQSLGAILQVATGLLMLMLLVRDMLVEITARSETDPLSSVYNRRGFEERATPGLQHAGVPAALVLADLDAFKSINDRYGHANLAIARLLAETLRTGFAALPVAGLPPFVRCTASFGVAERMDGESLSGLRRRADAALYAAKRDGRDRVAIADDPHADAMPAHPLAGTSLAKSA